MTLWLRSAFRTAVALLAEGVDRNIYYLFDGWDKSTSPSSQRAWIEIIKSAKLRSVSLVALLAEGVDRNAQAAPYVQDILSSPSSQRAWIEIPEVS